MRHLFKNIGLRFDRSFSRGTLKQVLWLVGLMMVIYLLLGGLSYFRQLYIPEATDSDGRWYDIIYLLMDPGSISDAMSPPFVVLIALIGLVVFTGMLISLISNILGRRVDSFLSGKSEYEVSNHVVALGYNSGIPSLLSAIRKRHENSFVLLMSEMPASEVRDLIFANASHIEEKHLIILNGRRYADEDLKRLYLGNHVKEVYVLGEENEADHDTINLMCVKKIASIIPKESEPVECHVQIDSNTMFSVLQGADFADSKIDNGNAIRDHLKFLPFNFNEIWSQMALATIPSRFTNDWDIKYIPLDGESGITSSCKRHVHFIIVGMNDMSTSLAVNAAHILHFPNFKEGNLSTCSRITFIDKDANNSGRIFRNRYCQLFKLARWRHVDATDCLDEEKGWVDPWATPTQAYSHLGDVNFLDILWEFIDGDVIDDNIQAYLSACSNQDNEITTIAFCYEDSEMNAELCLALPESICKSANTILVRQKESPVIVDLIRRMPHFDRVRPFGMMTACYRENLISDKYGKLINASYCKIDLSQTDTPELTKSIEKAWAECRSYLNKWSNVYCANMLFIKLRSMGLSDESIISRENIEALIHQDSIKAELQQTEHNRWVTEKLLLGFCPLSEQEQHLWLSSAEEMKNQKKHRLICSNSLLPDEEKQKDDDVNSNLWVLYQRFKEK